MPNLTARYTFWRVFAETVSRDIMSFLTLNQVEIRLERWYVFDAQESCGVYVQNFKMVLLATFHRMACNASRLRRMWHSLFYKRQNLIYHIYSEVSLLRNRINLNVYNSCCWVTYVTVSLSHYLFNKHFFLFCFCFMLAIRHHRRKTIFSYS